ncbi:glycine betaine ABC transporter substrate-binding protein [Caldibacillus thermoamylovorans]|uniref:glycine betaine ABC transporter substrate-binding protein n=1 Tax=Caldibacillus thermoamylovorans TaxID=35841 RepID=UPI001D090983|nr:glycine betaine ABC transporter substrate-binding protein [Caldibacillus thermoamylovorans]MCB5936856.1 glycine betaine ABC transporter substrate-binding protein [Bacillus sp. DFI.2.34]MCB7078500.1 glycine betaine ABC transporter substrate-binding protein [Caldibacillus thermoamylovorans]
MVGMMLIFLAACGGNDDENVTDTGEVTEISIGLTPYDYATVAAYVTQVALEQEGYEVEIVEADVGVIYEALSRKDLDATIDVWDPHLHRDYIAKYGDSFEMVGPVMSNMLMGIAVPTYMEDIHTIEDVANNNFYSIEPGSGIGLTTEEMVEVYEMDEYTIQFSSTQAMLAQVEASINREKPIVFNAWRPHPMFVRYDIKMIEDPREVWDLDDVKVGMTPELKEESPTAYTLFSNMNFSLDFVEEWLMEIDAGIAPRELAENFVEENQDLVDEA